MTDSFENAPELIRVEDLHKSFGSLKVLNGITETIHKGEVVSLIGRPVRANRLSCAVSTGLRANQRPHLV